MVTQRGSDRLRAPATLRTHRIDGDTNPAATIRLANNLGSYLPESDGRRAPEPMTKTVACQTMYRESETQTNPYSPDYIIVGDGTPDVFMASHLSYTNATLPVGLEEVDELERIMKKQQLEANLPEAVDEKSLEKRRQIIEKSEAAEWAHRENQLKQIQAQRLDMIEDHLSQRNAEIEQESQKKVDRLRLLKEAELQVHIEKIAKKRAKLGRNMARARKRLKEEQCPKKRDVIDDYSNPASKLYAPERRDGFSHVRRMAPEHRRPGVLQEMGSLNVAVQHTLSNGPVPLDMAKIQHVSLPQFQGREGSKLSHQLDKTYKAIFKADSSRIGSGNTYNKYKDVKVVVRPETPSIDMPEHAPDEGDALSYLQSIVRGRAIQMEHLSGLERNAPLIKEMRKVHSGTQTPRVIEPSQEDVDRAKKDVIIAKMLREAEASRQ